MAQKEPSIRPTIPASELHSLQHLLRITENGLMVLGIGGVNVVRDLRNLALRLEREWKEAMKGRTAAADGAPSLSFEDAAEVAEAP